jgi:uncharacterized membrane protein YgdD (TMEM256/DUF423 family)
MDKRKAAIAAIIIAVAIMLGAFGAHGLKEKLPVEKLLSFETGVRYQLLMGLGMLVLAMNSEKFDFKLKPIWIMLVFGVIFFSGSIYLLAIQGILGVKLSFLWPITPLGGLLMIGAWLWLTKNLLLRGNSRF